MDLLVHAVEHAAMSRGSSILPRRLLVNPQSFPMSKLVRNVPIVNSVRTVLFLVVDVVVGVHPEAKPCPLGRSVRAHGNDWRGGPPVRDPRLHFLITLLPGTLLLRLSHYPRHWLRILNAKHRLAPIWYQNLDSLETVGHHCARRVFTSGIQECRALALCGL